MHGALIVHDVVVSHILPREDRSATGRAKRGRDESIGEMSSFAGKAIEIRGLQKLRSFFHEAQEIVAMIVAENENDVLLFFSVCSTEEEKGSEEEEEF